MATDKNKHLECVLSSHKVSKEQSLLDKHSERKIEIKEAMEQEYGDRMYSPFLSGSFAKNTAVNSKFDFDLMTPFKRNAFGSTGTLKEMYENVFNFLYEKYINEATVRKQKVSIGIEFYPDKDGHVVKIDVVPGRELNLNQYKDDNKVNLYVYEQFGNISQGSDYILSNIQAQIKNIRDRATAEKDSIRKSIRLLKVWKIGRGYGPKSFFLELITIKAFDSETITGNTWDKLKKVMEYIRDNVKTVPLPDPGNSGNDVAETLTAYDKTLLSDDMKLMLERIEENSDNIKSYYQINEKHPCEEEKTDNKYGVKKDEVSTPPVTRFG
ncbi:MAG: hypothetical protein U0U66_05460 [Cytophagaceae bacterium]